MMKWTPYSKGSTTHTETVCGETCNTCDPTVYSTCGLLRRASNTRIVTEYFLSEAARRWKPFTDTICDTSKCLSCPDYSWCHRLREIYDEGVLCYDSSIN